MNTPYESSDAILHEELSRFSSHTVDPERSLELFAAAQGRCPVARSDEHDGFHMLLDYDGVRRATSDFKVFSSQPQVVRPVLPRPPFAALEMDPPQHKSWRAFFEQAVTPHTVKVLEPIVRADINRHIDGFIERGSADLVSEFAGPIPSETIFRLVGIDDDLIMEIRDRAHAMFAAMGNPEEFGARMADFAEIALAQVRDRQASPREDYLTYLAHVELDGKPLEDADFLAVLAGFLGAGHHSTTSAMSSLIFEVFSRTNVRTQIENDPAKMLPIAVEESLRLRPPFFGFYRRATTGTEVAGVQIKQGDDVYLGWASANRDPKVFECPQDFRMDRGRNRHLSFGAGIHTCPGASLARMELRVAMEEILRRLPDLTIEIEQPEYAFSGGDLAHMPQLPVRFTPGSRENGTGS